MAGREHGVTGVEGVLKVQLLEAIWVKERWQRHFQLPATKVPKTEVTNRPHLDWWAPIASYESSHSASR